MLREISLKDALEIAKKREVSSGASDDGMKIKVSEIIGKIRMSGDEAIRELNEKFDNYSGEIEVSEKELEEAVAKVDANVLRALEIAKKNIEKVSRMCMPKNVKVKNEFGTVEMRWNAIERIGIYAPGGRATYPSTVLMCCVPASVAGVKEIIMCTPPNASPVILAAAKLCGVKRIFRIGGAQAVAAMAFGTESVPKVGKIVGPGNAFVNEAKKQVQGMGAVDIDSPAGPSEALIIADKSTEVEVIAAEFLAQLEHDPDAESVLVCTDRKLLQRVGAKVDELVKVSARKEIVEKALEKSFAVVCSIDEAVEFANEYACEHVQLSCKKAGKVAERIVNAGAVFIGKQTTIPYGDYSAGSNHVLPTSGTAKFASALNILSFMKATYYVKVEEGKEAEIADAGIAIAEAEGLGEHANAIKARKKKTD
ncbi:Histidinol dehydrogenase [Candidatus Gugararchaeum adminiculabundum]|nr:Histidinol dehydrogenase [Candidatus Gugararchaeum adminiculabundum]